MTISPTTPPSTPRKSPKNLSSEARRIWNRSLIEYSFTTEAEFALLQQLCETHDRLRQIQQEIKAQGLVTLGYKGQPRANPLLTAESNCREMFLKISRALGLASDEK